MGKVQDIAVVCSDVKRFIRPHQRAILSKVSLSFLVCVRSHVHWVAVKESRRIRGHEVASIKEHIGYREVLILTDNDK